MDPARGIVLGLYLRVLHTDPMILHANELVEEHVWITPKIRKLFMHER
jgi:hypothetical protein